MVTLNTVGQGKLTHCGFRTNPQTNEMTIAIGIYMFSPQDFISFAAHVIAGGTMNWPNGIPKFVENAISYLNQRLEKRRNR